MTDNQHFVKSLDETQDQSEITTRLLTTLHKGGQKTLLQTLDGEKRKSYWLDAGDYGQRFDKLFNYMSTGHNAFFGVNPTMEAVTDRDREKYTKDGKTPKDEWIAERVASKNETIAAVNCVFAEFDGKDETNPTEIEIEAEIAGVRAAKQSMVASGEMVKMPSDKAIYNEAVGTAKIVKYLTDSSHYNDLAYKRLMSAPLVVSVAWFSGGGYQGIWLFDKTFSVDSKEAFAFIAWLQGAWVGTVGADPGAKDLRRILRLPGTQNVKKLYAPKYPTVTYVKADFDCVYSIDQFVALVPERPKEDPAQVAKKSVATNGNGSAYAGDSVIDAFNDAYLVTNWLDANGYTGTGTERSRPGAPDSNGVNISEDGKYSWHWSSNDPLHEVNAKGNPHKVTPFKAFLVLEHDGNMKEAVKAAAKMMGMEHKSNGHYDGFNMGNPESLVKQTAAELIAGIQEAYTNGHTSHDAKALLMLQPGAVVGCFYNDIDVKVTVVEFTRDQDGVKYYNVSRTHDDGTTDTWEASEKELYLLRADADVDTGEIDAGQPVELSADAILAAIAAIRDTEYTLSDDADQNAKQSAKVRRDRIIKELSFAIGCANKADQPLIADALVDANAGFKATAASKFVDGCAADAKKARKAAKVAKKAAKATQSTQQRTKPVIDTYNRQLDALEGETLLAVLKHNMTQQSAPILYSQNGKLVKVILAGDRHTLLTVEADQMLSIMGKVADWIQEYEDQDGVTVTVNILPPSPIVKSFLGRGEWPGLQEIYGITNCPTFAADGSLHVDYGYSDKTRMFYSGGVTLGDTAPTPENVACAKSLLLNDLFVDFPFVGESSKAHTVALAIQPLVRGMIDGPTPLYLVDAPTQSTGKGKLIASALVPALGNTPVSYPGKGDDDDEWRKQITSCLVDGSPVVVFDNLTGTLNAPALAIVLTESVYGDRILGRTGSAQIPVRTTFAATANNVSLGDDLIRRTVWIRIDANMEDPSKRTGYKHELPAWAKVNRDALLTALVTLVNKWIADGMPRFKDKIKGSYESWCGIMGGILQSAGIPGFLDNDEELRKVSFSRGDAISEFVKEWARQFGVDTIDRAKHGDRVTANVSSENWMQVDTIDRAKHGDRVSAKDLFAIASHNDDAQWERDDPMQPKAKVDHLNLLGDLLGSKKPQGRKTALGTLLSTTLRDKVIAGLKVCPTGKAPGGAATYYLTEVVPGAYGLAIAKDEDDDDAPIIV